MVKTIPIDSDDANGVRVVFGVGKLSDRDLENISAISAQSLTRGDIELDVLKIRERPLDPENVISVVIPEIIRPGPNNYVPVHKYLYEIGLNAARQEDLESLPAIIRTLALREYPGLISRDNTRRFERDIQGKHFTPFDVIKSDNPEYFKLDCLVLLDQSNYDPEDLRIILADWYPKAIQDNRITSQFRRALCHYDKIMYFGLRQPESAQDLYSNSTCVGGPIPGSPSRSF